MDQRRDTRPSSSNSGKASFLGLSVELRYLIHQHLIFEDRDLPETLPEVPETYPDAHEFVKKGAPIESEAARPSVPALLQLKQSSKQNYVEVSETIRTCKHRERPAHLDITASFQLRPTWIYLPLTGKFGKTLHVTLRLFDFYMWPERSRIEQLIHSLIARGPLFDRATRELSSPLPIEALEVEVCQANYEGWHTKGMRNKIARDLKLIESNPKSPTNFFVGITFCAKTLAVPRNTPGLEHVGNQRLCSQHRYLLDHEQDGIGEEIREYDRDDWERRRRYEYRQQ